MAVLPNKQIWGVQDNADRQASAIAALEIAEIVEIYPHADIYPSDKRFMVVDLKIRDLKKPPDDQYDYCKFTKVMVMQHGIGNLWGKAWMPRQGDVVLVQRFKNSDNIVVVGQLYNQSQEPVVTQYDTDFYISKVDKWIQHEQPQKWPDGTSTFKNFVPGEYKQPSERDHTTNQPVCEKIFGKNRDCMQVYGCDHGYYAQDPYCKNCVRTGYIEVPEVAVIRTNSKETTNQDGSARDDTKPKYEKARRLQILHHNGGQMTWDDDGNLLLQNATRSGATSTDKGHLKLNEYGTTEIQSVPTTNTTTGARCRVYAPSEGTTDNYGTISAELINQDYGSHVKIYTDGMIRIVAGADKAVIQLKNDGTITIETTGDITYSSDGDINFTSDTSVNLTAPEITLNGVVYT